METNSKQNINSTKKVDFAADDVIERAINKAVTEALKMHKLAKNPVAVWRDGKVVILSPYEIMI